MNDFDKFNNKVLRFLSFRPRSEKEIKEYLNKQKANDVTAGKIIRDLKEHKFIDDAEFARWWIEQRTRLKPKAWRVIKLELKRKDISEETIENIVNGSEFNVPDDLKSAMDLAEKRMRRYSKLTDRKKIYEKLGRFLASKGFDYDTIKEVIDQVLPKEYNK